jgi:hypothetical protein
MTTRETVRRVRHSLLVRSERALVAFIRGPWVRLLRRSTSLRQFGPGATVVAVNYNTLPYMQANGRRGAAPFAERHAHIVDNASSDGTVAWARSQQGVGVIRLPVRDPPASERQSRPSDGRGHSVLSH